MDEAERRAIADAEAAELAGVGADDATAEIDGSGADAAAD
jgi:DNA-directed RNA polymerase subunit beta'